MQSPLLGLADLVIIFLLAVILWLTYRPLDALASILWLAYLCWILMLLLINAVIWWLNA